jgi:peptidoglycan/LPS O-acetylase OafA/YrhL
MFCHMPRMHSRWLLNVQENGSSGVSLFFVISGFLITTLFLREPATPRPLRGLLQFFGRRAIRLWPAYYAVITSP